VGLLPVVPFLVLTVERAAELEVTAGVSNRFNCELSDFIGKVLRYLDLELVVDVRDEGIVPKTDQSARSESCVEDAPEPSSSRWRRPPAADVLSAA
jgi:hypothetical protein